MPIVVRHEPDPQLLANMGYQIGQGMQIQYQEEMAQRERMQSRAIQANLLSQRIAQDEAAFRQANALGSDMMRQQLGFGQADKMQEMKFQNQRELQELKSEDQKDQTAYEWNMRRENTILGGMVGGQRDMGKAMLTAIQKSLNDYAAMKAQGFEFDPQTLRQMDLVVNEVNDLLVTAGSGNEHSLAAVTGAYIKSQQLTPGLGGVGPTPQQEAQASVQQVDVGGRPQGMYRKGDDWVPMKPDDTEQKAVQMAQAAAKIKGDIFKLARDILIDNSETGKPPTLAEIEAMAATIMSTSPQGEAKKEPANKPGQPVAKPAGNFEGMLEIPDPAAAALMGAQ